MKKRNELELLKLLLKTGKTFSRASGLSLAESVLFVLEASIKQLSK
jgi:hypothetical protein